MIVEQVMTLEVKTCHPEDPLSRPAEIMWRETCGAVPVVDHENRLVGMITDRDICMAAYLQGEPLWNLVVSSAMARNVCSVEADQRLEQAQRLMRERHVRRLPVVDVDDHVIGLLSLSDIAREANGQTGANRWASPAAVGETLAAVSQYEGD